jgi:hypothetical protein
MNKPNPCRLILSTCSPRVDVNSSSSKRVVESVNNIVPSRDVKPKIVPHSIFVEEKMIEMRIQKYKHKTLQILQDYEVRTSLSGYKGLDNIPYVGLKSNPCVANKSNRKRLHSIDDIQNAYKNAISTYKRNTLLTLSYKF